MNIFGLVLLGLLAFSAFINIRKRGWKLYIMQVLFALDLLGNTLIGGRIVGGRIETISSRCERGRLRGIWYWRWLATFLNWLDPNHTMDALRSERAHSGS